MAAAGLRAGGRVPWRAPAPDAPGVYAICLTGDPGSCAGSLASCPLSEPAVRKWLRARLELAVDGERPTRRELEARIASCWLPQEVVLYIGKAGGSLRHRVGAYYGTPLGRSKPHAGGRFLKTLTVLDELWVHYAVCDSDRAEGAEEAMMGAFIGDVSASSCSSLCDPAHPFPFANLEWRRRDPATGRRRRHLKAHGVSGDTE
jgi:hypothetical protein